MKTDLVLSLESPDDGERDYFASIADIEVGAEGEIIVLDEMAGRVTVFEPSGEPRVSFGRSGEGPGELLGPTHVLSGDEGDIVVADAAQQRLVRFSPEGEHRATVELPSEELVTIDWAGTDRGDIVTQYRPGGMAALAAGDGRPPFALGLVEWDDGTVRHVVDLPEDATFGGGTRFLAPKPLWAVARDGRMVITTSSSREVRIAGLDGTQTATISVPRRPHPVSESEKDAMTAAARAGFVEMGLPEDLIEDLMESSFDVADEYPVFTDVFLGPDRTLWLLKPVRVEGLLEDAEGIDFDSDFGVRGHTWEVYGVEGEPLGDVAFPEGFRPHTYHGDRIYGVHADSLGVETVRVYRIEL